MLLFSVLMNNRLNPTHNAWSELAEAFQPQPLAEPYLNLSIHTAPIVHHRPTP